MTFADRLSNRAYHVLAEALFAVTNRWDSEDDYWRFLAKIQHMSAEQIRDRLTACAEARKQSVSQFLRSRKRCGEKTTREICRAVGIDYEVIAHTCACPICGRETSTPDVVYVTEKMAVKIIDKEADQYRSDGYPEIADALVRAARKIVREHHVLR